MTGTYNICVNQGCDWSMTLTWTAGSPLTVQNLTNWTAHMQVRPGFASDTEAVLLDLSSGAGSIVLGGTAGTIQISIANATSSALNFTQAVYDLKMTNPSGLVTRLLQGQFMVSPEVTV